MKRTVLKLSHIASHFPHLLTLWYQNWRSNEVIQGEEERRGEGNAVPCDAAIADFICHFPSQGQCCWRVQWSYKSDNREKQREIYVCTPHEIAGCLECLQKRIGKICPLPLLFFVSALWCTLQVSNLYEWRRVRARVCLTRSCFSPTLHLRDSSAFLKEKTLNPKIVMLRFWQLHRDGGVLQGGVYRLHLYLLFPSASVVHCSHSMHLCSLHLV